jgi:putative SOS response-associated peptidase YedK
VAVIPNNNDLHLDFFRWGLIPAWAKDQDIGNRLINARAETLPEKPSFRSALIRRRCLILADGFYEWKSSPGEKLKIPYYIHLSSGRAFAFAGLWDTWKSPGGAPISSCAIITTTPNSLIEPIHNRMPVILPHDSCLGWLKTGDVIPSEVKPLLSPYSAEEMDAYPVSRMVNDPKIDTSLLIMRV